MKFFDVNAVGLGCFGMGGIFFLFLVMHLKEFGESYPSTSSAVTPASEAQSTVISLGDALMLLADGHGGTLATSLPILMRYLEDNGFCAPLEDNPQDHLAWRDWPFVSSTCTGSNDYTARRECEGSALTAVAASEEGLYTEAAAVVKVIEPLARAIAGDTYWMWSVALDPPVALAQYAAVKFAARRAGGRGVNYLEVGSHKGTSMAFVAASLAALGVPAASLTSVDPYLDNIQPLVQADAEATRLAVEEGGKLVKSITALCRSGSLAPSGQACSVAARAGGNGNAFMASAFALYELAGINVTLHRGFSNEGLAQLAAALVSGPAPRAPPADLIYIDGEHSGMTPLFDVIVALANLNRGGVLILDDWFGGDIFPLKLALDECLPAVFSSWKTAAYYLGQ